ncbi:MAG: ATP-binding protein [Candidatus Acidiferrum sp.]
MATQAEITIAALKELFDLWETRAALYREVMYSSAILRGPENVWRNVFTFFQPLHRSEVRSTNLTADYDTFKLAQGLLPLGSVKNALTEVAEKGQLALPDQPIVSLKAYLHPGSSRYFSRGDAKNYPVFFPFFEYRFGVEQSDKASPPQGTVWAPNLPLYPSGHVAIEELFCTRLGTSGAYDGVLSALVPDYRGKISEIRLLNDGVAVRVICLAGADPKDLAGKLYCEGYHGIRFTENLEFDDDGKAFASTKGFPRQLVVAVFSKSSKDLIDERTFDAGSPYLPGDLTIEELEQDVENLVKGGESDTIEFKSQIPKSQEAMAITSVAFANRKGGRIFVGVENDGQIVGCPGTNVKDSLTSILRDRCEPPIEFSVTEAMVAGKPVYIVVVLEGKDKPYQVKEKGFYLRTGATNRLVTRYELDEMYGNKSGNLALRLPGIFG